MIKKNERRKCCLNRLIVIEIVVCYMVLLTIISYARGPERYQALTSTPLLQSEDFVPYLGDLSKEAGFVFIENETLGIAVGYAAPLELHKDERFQVSFWLDCPAEFAGGALYTDLFNGETAYDSPEQEVCNVLQVGHNEFQFSLDTGENPPDTALLRFFTGDYAGYQLNEIQVCREEMIPKVSKKMWAVLSACLLTLAGTIFAWRKG